VGSNYLANLAKTDSLFQRASQADENYNNWKQLNSQATELSHQGEIAVAIPIAKQALELARKSAVSNPLEALSLGTLGSLYKSQGRWTEAEPLLDRALAICEKFCGDRPESIAVLRQI
jgi:tetratricopeptide (TPR) repeat protein